jgi:ubiquinone/menaquinone biosynthesis C-methylase UbiE
VYFGKLGRIDMLEDLNRAVRDTWDRKATFWDQRMGDGNLFQRVLLGPATERLLRVEAGQRILDVACGNGAFARRLADLGAQVVAIDFSQKFLELARARDAAEPRQIDYRLVDATDARALLALGEASFDAAVCTMGLMDMVTIEPLMRALSRLLKSGGRFVFSVLHPAFNISGASSLVVERKERDGQLREHYSVTISGYLHVEPQRGVGMPGEPEPHLYFHRSLSALLTACFQAGFVLDGLEEPAFPRATADVLEASPVALPRVGASEASAVARPQQDVLAEAGATSPTLEVCGAPDGGRPTLETVEASTIPGPQTAGVLEESAFALPRVGASEASAVAPPDQLAEPASPSQRAGALEEFAIAGPHRVDAPEELAVASPTINSPKTPEVARPTQSPAPIAWESFTDIPPVLVARLRRATEGPPRGDG